MKKLFLWMWFCCISGILSAQNDGTHPDSLSVSLPTDSLSVPLTPTTVQRPFLMVAPGLDGCQPWWSGTYGPLWELHEGWNAQFSLSLTAGLGKGAPSGVGFGQSAALAYALPIGKKFSVTAGLYAQGLDWGPLHRTDVGVAAAFGYHINERISLYAYGTKSFLPKNTWQPGLYPPFWEVALRDRIGAMASFKIGKNAAIHISIEHSSAPALPVFPMGFSDPLLPHP